MLEFISMNTIEVIKVIIPILIALLTIIANMIINKYKEKCTNIQNDILFNNFLIIDIFTFIAYSIIVAGFIIVYAIILSKMLLITGSTVFYILLGIFEVLLVYLIIKNIEISQQYIVCKDDSTDAIIKKNKAMKRIIMRFIILAQFAFGFMGVCGIFSHIFSGSYLGYFERALLLLIFIIMESMIYTLFREITTNNSVVTEFEIKMRNGDVLQASNILIYDDIYVIISNEMTDSGVVKENKIIHKQDWESINTKRRLM